MQGTKTQREREEDSGLIELRAKLKIRDVFLILSSLGVIGNAAWCYQHQIEIDHLRKQITASAPATPGPANHTGAGAPKNMPEEP